MIHPVIHFAVLCQLQALYQLQAKPHHLGAELLSLKYPEA